MPPLQIQPLLPTSAEASSRHVLPHHSRHKHHHHSSPHLSAPLPMAKDPKSGVLVQPWVRIDAEGNSTVLQEGRLQLITDLGIQGRDLRLLEDPPSGGTFLLREDAIIASLDFGCIIITTQAAYVVNPTAPATIKFVTMLKQRLAAPAAIAPGGGGFKTWQEKEQQLLVEVHAQHARSEQPEVPPPPKHAKLWHHQRQHQVQLQAHQHPAPPQASAAPGPEVQAPAPRHSPFFFAMSYSQSSRQNQPPPSQLPPPQQQQQQEQPKAQKPFKLQAKELQEGKAHFVPRPHVLPISQSTETQPLPFELRVLELCLFETCSGLAASCTQLEGMAMPLVDILLKQAEVGVLEKLRVAKKQLAELTTKAAQVCSVLKALLDDENDMWGMHLTAKEAQRAAAQEAAMRMLEEVDAMADQAGHVPRLEKVEEEEVELEHSSVPVGVFGLTPATAAAAAPSEQPAPHPLPTQPQQPPQQPSVPPAWHASFLGDDNDHAGALQLGREAQAPAPPHPTPLLLSRTASSSIATTSQGSHALSLSGLHPALPPQLPLSSTAGSSSASDNSDVVATAQQHAPLPPPASPAPPPPAPPTITTPASLFISPPLLVGDGGRDGDGSGGSSRGGHRAGGRLSEQNLRHLGSPSQSIGMGLEGSSPGGRSSGLLGRGSSIRGHSNPSGSSSSSSSGEFDLAVSQVEMLIESYYLQLDDAYNRLKAMAEYIEDAEDMVHLHLNATQNVLLTHDLVFSIIAAVCGVLFTVAQFFTMNMEQGPFQAWPWFFDFFAPTITIGSCVVVGGIIVFSMHIYLYHVVTGKSWFSSLCRNIRSRAK